MNRLQPHEMTRTTPPMPIKYHHCNSHYLGVIHRCPGPGVTTDAPGVNNDFLRLEAELVNSELYHGIDGVLFLRREW